MKKLIVLLTSLTLLTSCGMENNVTINNQTNTLQNVTQPNNENVITDISDETESLYEYDVTVDQSNFSNDDLIYFIMIDRFSDGDTSNNNFEDYSDDKSDLKSYLGGDLRGVINQLDYIKTQGATAIWLTPVVKNEPYGYHGYWTSDFESVDPHFGDLDTLKELVETAHEKDIKVILDYIVNHTGYQHEWLNDPDKQDWFHNNGTITDFKNDDQVLNYNLAGLPDLNTENPEVKDYFYNNVLWWIKETGVDGLRLDTVRHVPNEFWNEFAYIIKQEYPDFFLLGEVFVSSPSFLASYNEVGFDSITNYSMYDGILETFRIYGDANKLKIAINNDSKFSNRELNGIFLDNHDVSRLISRTSKHGEAYLKQGLTFLMTYPSIPIVYYGTEIGLEGKSDPDNRQMMDFDATVDNEIYDYYQMLVTLRDETKDYDTVEILEAKSDYIVLNYTNGVKNMIVAFNVSLYDKNIMIEGSYKDYITQETISGDIVLKSLESLILLEE